MVGVEVCSDVLTGPRGRWRTGSGLNHPRLDLSTLQATPLCLLALHPGKRLARKSETWAWRPLGCEALPHNFRARQKLHFSHLKTIEIKII